MGVRVKFHKGCYWVFADHNYKRKAWKVGEKDAAESFAADVRKGIKNSGKISSESVESTGPTVKEYYGRFENYLVAAVRKSTKRIYDDSFRLHINPTIGQKAIDEVKREDVEKLIGALVKKNLSRASIRVVSACLCAFMNYAMERGLIQSNPARRLTKFYKQARVSHPEILPLSADEVKSFLAEAQKHWPEYYPLFLCAIHSGLRSGELAALQWGDIDFAGRFLMVRFTLINGERKPTKNDKIRKVDASDVLLAELRRVQQSRIGARNAGKRDFVPEWVFCNKEGKALDMKNVYHRAFKACLRLAELHHRRFHDLRHTYASLLVSAGESLAYVRDQMGHSSITLTVNTYTHLIPGANRDAVNRLPVPEIQETAKVRKFKKGRR